MRQAISMETLAMADGKARVAVVTGASSGIGQQVASALVAAGWHVIGTGRDAGRCEAAAARIGAAGPDGRIDMLRADLSLMSGASRLAGEIRTLSDRIDVLVNNAGGMTDRLEITPEGLEANYAGNHLGPFMLTALLLPLLQATAAQTGAGNVRILMTASDASEMIPAINLDDLQNLSGFNPGLSYCAGKLANVLFARGLAERLAGSGIVAHAMAPGPVATNFYQTAPADTKERLRDLPMRSEAEGADTLIWLATAAEPGASTGGYWEDRKPRKPNPLVEDAAVVDRFWQESERLVRSVIADWPGYCPL
jgi:NAD(P)-dependent dehydrogenase (short-subunit alcohol dehydrogenase family)